MKVLITEYVLSTYYRNNAMINLMPEAFVMVRFLARSLIMSGAYVSITTSPLVNASLLSLLPGNIIMISPHDYLDKIKELSQSFDYVIVIAPPRELIEVIDSIDDRKLLQPSKDLIRLFSNKYSAIRELSRCGFKVPETKLINSKYIDDTILETHLPIIIKPVYLAGSECVYLVGNNSELGRALLNVINCDPYGMAILQEFINGVHGSISVIYGVNGPLFYSLNLQFIKNINGSLHFIGGALPIRKKELLSVVERIIHDLFTCYPKLRGYVGLDIVWNDEGIYIIEVNPRPTTSIVGIISLYPSFGKYLLSIYSNDIKQASFLGSLANDYAYYVLYDNLANNLGINENISKEVISIGQRTVEVGRANNLINIYQRIKPLLSNLIYDMSEFLC